MGKVVAVCAVIVTIAICVAAYVYVDSTRGAAERREDRQGRLLEECLAKARDAAYGSFKLPDGSYTRFDDEVADSAFAGGTRRCKKQYG